MRCVRPTGVLQDSIDPVYVIDATTIQSDMLQKPDFKLHIDSDSMPD